MMVVTFGRLVEGAIHAARSLLKEGTPVSVVRFGVLKGFDPKRLEEIFFGAKRILFVEEGAKIGGFSEYLLSLLQERGLLKDVKTKVLAIEDEFIPHGTAKELLHFAGLDAEGIEKELKKLAET